MAGLIVNQFGRKPGRGLRPWLIVPKVLAVAIYFGGLSAAAFVWFTRSREATQQLWIINTISALMRFLVVPGLLAAMVFGILLLLQHPRTFARLRWVIVKLLVLLVFVPTAHFSMSWLLAKLRLAATELRVDANLELRFSLGMAVALAGSALVIVLGRLKPRLGQNWARTYPTTTPTPQRA